MLYRSRSQADAAAEKIRVFAQPLRLMILSCLLDGERTVGAIEQATGIVQPALSQQLAELRRAELVQTRRAAKTVHYRLADENAATCVRAIETVFGTGAPLALMAERPTTLNRSSRELWSGAAAFAEIL